MKSHSPRRHFSAGTAAGFLTLAISLHAQLPTQIRVDLAPAEAVTAGAAWRLAGETAWRPSGVFQTDLPPGVYLLEYKPIPGWLAPRLANAVSLGPESTVVVAVTYPPQPDVPLTVTSTEGGYVRGEDWAPTGFGTSGGLDLLESQDWEAAVRKPTGFDFIMPRENRGWRVRLRALPFPGYRFIGWAGDATSYRNPITLIMNRPYAVSAQFARTFSPVAEAVQSADAYHSPGTLVVHGQFNRAPGEQVGELRWRPSLPAGWTLTAASGLANPRLEDDQIRFSDSLGHNPIVFNMEITVPPGPSGPRELGGTVEYRPVGSTNFMIRPVRSLLGPGNLVLNSRPNPAARLGVRPRENGQPRLEISGVIGRTYTLEHVPEFFTGYERFWWFLSDVLLTNSPQTWIDDTSLRTQSSGMYRAVLIE